jgi:hypothetical protein
MKKVYILSFLLIVVATHAQVGIGTTNPNPNAELEILSTTKGFLMPRLTQANRNFITTNGMLSYTIDVNPGFYYRQGGWVPVSAATLGWPLLGKSGALAAAYVGTSDAQPFVFRTNNVDRMRFLSAVSPAIGFIGIGTNAPTTNLHVQGITPSFRLQDGTEGLNKIIVSDATGVASWASAGSVFTPDWDTFGNSIIATNFLGTLASLPVQDLIIKTANTEKVRVQADGNIRIGTTAAAVSQLEVRSALSGVGNATIKGINNNTIAGAESRGVIGVITSTQVGSNAIKGQMFSADPTATETGLIGKYQTSGTGVFGLGYASNSTNFDAGSEYGVFGTVNFGTGTGVYGKSTQNLPGFDYGLYCEGNFATNGVISNGAGLIYPTVKAASVPTTKGNQLVYCKESPEMWFEDFGFGQLQNGTAHVALDAVFMETVFIDDAHRMHIVLQEQAESKGLYYTVDADYKGFTVKEKKGGNSNASFSYSIMAKRRFYQDHRFGVDALQPFGNNLTNMRDAEINTTDPMVMKAYVDKITTEKNVKFNKDKNSNPPGFSK